MRDTIGDRGARAGAGWLRTVRLMAPLLALGLCTGLPQAQAAPANTSCLRDPARVQELRQIDEERVADQQRRYGPATVPPRIHALAHRVQDASEVLRHKPRVRVLGYTFPALAAHAADHGVLILASGIWSEAGGLSDDEIAAVLAHELAHIEMTHSLEEGCAALARMALPNAPLQDALSTLDIELFNGSSELATAVRSELHRRELEADARGAELLRRAGFHPRAMLRLLKTIGQVAPSGRAPWGREGHPAADLRLEAVQAHLRAPKPTAAARLRTPARQ
jgi:beta-barrel assembly-enhancing protease